jgi:hypothetical protein
VPSVINERVAMIPKSKDLVFFSNTNTIVSKTKRTIVANKR